MDFNEVKKWLEENKNNEEVKQYLAGLNPLEGLTKENAHEYVEKIPELKSYRDSYLTRSIETWKNNNLDKIVSEKLNELNPPETEEQKKLRELTERLNRVEREKQLEALRAKALKRLSEKKLPVELADFLIADDEATTETRLEAVAKIIEAERSKAKEQLFKENGRAPVKSPNNKQTAVNPWKKETYNLTEQMRLLKTNPELAKAMKAEANL